LNLFGLEHTVTQGIISATGRVIGSGPYDNFLQTDAPINPGNSGGPLVNLKGEVIGINTAIVATGQGIGFAIPSNMAKSITSQLKEKGKVVRGWIGISIQSMTPEIAQAFGLKEPKGALVGDVAPGGPADSAGIKRGDIIIAFDGKDVKDMSDLPRIVAETTVGKTVEVKVIRDRKEITLKVTVAEMTEERLASQMRMPEKSLGMTVDDIKPRWRSKFNIKDRTGVVIIDITPDSPAEDAGLQIGDIIKEVNRMPVRGMKDYNDDIRKPENGKTILFLIKRGMQTFYVSIQIS
jgi:serine protease Do